MFSGIVESVQKIVKVEVLPGAVRIQIQKPSEFNDLKIGDSISVNGACLTLEAQTPTEMSFALAQESLNVLEIVPDQLGGQRVNLERSLRFGDRIHGHLVTGHVEALGEVLRSEASGESWFMDIKVPAKLSVYLWKKGSITLHGVSLTVNEVSKNIVSVCLIPETLKRTNLMDLAVGSKINVEPDYFAKAILQQREIHYEL